jgi:hypothetical protein
LNRRFRDVCAASAALVLASAQSALAHHAFAAEYDANKLLTLRGTVSKVEWINQHASIHVDVKDPDGKDVKDPDGKIVTWKLSPGHPMR